MTSRPSAAVSGTNSPSTSRSGKTTVNGLPAYEREVSWISSTAGWRARRCTAVIPAYPLAPRRRPGAFWSRAHEYTVKLHKDALVQVVPTKSRPSLRFRGVIWRVEEARLSASVAGRSRGAHPQENGVEVAVEAHLDDLHGVARGRALLPQAALA